MLGDVVRSEGSEYEVIWCGASDAAGVVPSLLCDYARPSALAGVAEDREVFRYGRFTPIQVRRAKRDLWEQA